MRILNAIFKRGKIKRLTQEIELLKPINTYLSNDYLWFDLNWRLVRRHTYFIENMNRNTEELLFTLSNEPQSYYLNLIDYVEKNILTINKYFKDNKSIITFKTFDFEFFEFYFMHIPKVAKKQREAFTNNKLSIARFRELNMMLFFYNEVLLRIQVVDYRIEELKSIV